MQKVQQTYTQHVNRRYARVGHVFQGRYKAFLVDDDAYLLALVRYIHLNPVRAGITAAPGDYPWSSHRHYAAGEGPGRVHTAFVREVLASYSMKSIEDCESLLLNPANGQTEEFPGGRPTRDPDGMCPAPEAVLRSVAAVTGVSVSNITGPVREHAASRARWLLAYYAVRLAGLSASTVARLVGRSPAAVTLAVNEVSARLAAGEKEWARMLAEVEALLGQPAPHQPS
ncbi:MAG: hypothetical protein QMC81_08265 [Thermoanaerobacterales bacterium]|nr:hypothetical protein [Thermoanaerobacterales bacterium]